MKAITKEQQQVMDKLVEIFKVIEDSADNPDLSLHAEVLKYDMFGYWDRLTEEGTAVVITEFMKSAFEHQRRLR